MLNECIFMGRLTAEPEQRTTSTGKAVCSFRIAIDRGYGEEKKADFVPCEAWNKTAEFIVKYFHKGDMIAVTGSLRSEQFTDKDGKNRTVYKVMCNNVSFCGSKNNSTGSTETTVNDAVIVDVENNADDDDLPF